jgi:hypothetical protein
MDENYVIKQDLEYQLKVKTGREHVEQRLINRSFECFCNESNYLRDGYYSIADIKNAVIVALSEQKIG